MPVTTFPPTVAQPPRDITPTGDLRVEAINITDSGPTGRALIQSDTAAEARGIIGAAEAGAPALPPDGNRGDITVSGSGANWQINAGAVGNTELANMAAETVKANLTGGAAAAQDVTLAALKAALALNLVDNTSDLNKPISTATQTALDLKANLASPTFTGTPSGPTAAPGANTTQFATTAFAAAALAAALISPAFTGTPTAPTAAPGTNTTQIATTAFVAAADALKLNSSAVSAFGLTLIDDADASAARTTLGLGTMATQAASSYLALSGGTMTGGIVNNTALGARQVGFYWADMSSDAGLGAGVFGSNLYAHWNGSGTDYKTSLTHASVGYGGLRVSGATLQFAGAAGATTAGATVTPTWNTVYHAGNFTTAAAFTSGAKGLVPASGGGTTNYLRADGSWAAPPGFSSIPTGSAATPGLPFTADANSGFFWQTTFNSGPSITVNGKEFMRIIDDGVSVKMAIGVPTDHGGSVFPSAGIDFDIHRDHEDDLTTVRAPVMRLDHAFGGAPSYLTDAWPILAGAVIGQSIAYFDGHLVGVTKFCSDTTAIPGGVTHTTKYDSGNRNTQGNFDHGYFAIAMKAHRNATLTDYFSVNYDGRVTLGGDRGAGALVAIPVASAVNYMTVYGAASGGHPLFQPDGSGTNIDMLLRPKGTGSIVMERAASDTQGMQLLGRKSRGSFGSQSDVSNGDVMFSLRSYAWASSAWREGASIYSQVDGSPSGTSMPTTLHFCTSASGSVTPSEGFALYADGAVRFHRIGTTGSGANAFLDSGSFNNLLRSTSSGRYKRDIEPMDAARVDNILSLAPVWYRSKAKADDPRHSFYGFIAEDVAKIDPRWVHWGYRDEDWIEEDDGTGHLVPTIRPGAVKVPDGVAYDRMVVPIIAKIQDHETRIRALEAA